MKKIISTGLFFFVLAMNGQPMLPPPPPGVPADPFPVMLWTSAIVILLLLVYGKRNHKR